GVEMVGSGPGGPGRGGVRHGVVELGECPPPGSEIMPAGPNAVVDPERLDETRCGMGDRGDAGSGSLERYPPPGLGDARHEQDAGAGPHGPHVSDWPADDLDVGAGADHLPPPSTGNGEETAVRFSGGESPEEFDTLVGVEVDDGDEVAAGAAGAVLCGVDRRGGDDRWAVPSGFVPLRVGDEHGEVGTREMRWAGGRATRESGDRPRPGCGGGTRCQTLRSSRWLRRRRAGQDDVTGVFLVSLRNAPASLAIDRNPASAGTATRLCSKREVRAPLM